ncbi:hypothetical protein [Chryseobacterium sp.]|uniref:hypothetical protein n=1 Tax=Chryseobacterium sp. TaxID=1871047 RepID=UPI0025C2168E|nr:hypothetical protein [Chryseobacterium sp.]
MKKLLLTTLLLIASFCFSQREIKDNNLYIFIGQKISINEFNPNPNITEVMNSIDKKSRDSIKSYFMDEAFHCQYKLIANVYNRLDSDTVQFDAYDHYGRPGFEKHGDVMLYLSKNQSEKLYHQKYIYDPVYKINEEWMGIYSFYFPNDHSKSWTKFKTVPFNKDGLIKLKLKSCDKKCQALYYPYPYFTIKDGYAYPKKAFKIDDIIAYRKKTTFLFK